MNNDIEKQAFAWAKAEKDRAAINPDYYCRTRDVFQARLDKMVSLLLKQKKAKPENIYLLAAIAGEIGNNSFDHNLGSCLRLLMKKYPAGLRKPGVMALNSLKKALTEEKCA